MLPQISSSCAFRKLNALHHFRFKILYEGSYSCVTALSENRIRHFSKHAKTPQNYYDVLEITPRAGKSQIKAAYYRLSKKYHPDMNKAEDAHDKFSNIVEAYEVLGNQRTRRLYDKGQRSGLHVRMKSHDADYEAIRKYQDIQSRSIVRNVKRKTGNEVFAGRTGIYDFDEYYRAHYGEHVQTQKTKAQRQEKVKEEYERIVEKKNFESSRLAVFLLLSMMFIVVHHSLREKAKSEENESK